MPTYDHPECLRAHIMNVYVREAYRRLGIGKHLMELVLEEASSRGVTHTQTEYQNESK